MPRISILGATGSIGTSALELIRRLGDRQDYHFIALTAGSDSVGLARLVREFRPQFAVLGDAGCGDEFQALTQDLDTICDTGEEALMAAAAQASDITLMAIAGIAGLKPALVAARHSRRLAIANKECLVSAGTLLTEVASACGCELLPVDSEHNAIFQLLVHAKQESLRRVLLTASGGPFRTLPPQDFASITIEQALKHPNWQMGRKNTIDSATMMNKGLEIIEAHYLFGLPSHQIDVVIHPQSLVHSLVEYSDSTMLAHLSPTDMKAAIGYAFSYPERLDLDGILDFLDLSQIGRLDFAAPDLERFPTLRLARQALEQGGIAPAVLNAANEAAVDAFLQGRIGFQNIANSVDYCLQETSDFAGGRHDDIASILEIDYSTRRLAEAFISGQS